MNVEHESINHHFVPQAYLRAWCTNHKLVSYMRAASTGSLSRKRLSPKVVMREANLNTVPKGTSANGLTANGLEQLLATNVDQQIPRLRAATAKVVGRVQDPELRHQLGWLLRVLSARTPATLAGMERAVADVIRAQTDNIHKMAARSRDGAPYLMEFLHPGRPRATSLAGLASLVTTADGAQLGWLNGDIHLVAVDAVRSALDYLGAGEFVTFEEPVVQWDTNPHGLLASFAISPERLLVMVERGREMTLGDISEALVWHCVGSIAYRRQLISRTELRGVMMERVATLLWP